MEKYFLDYHYYSLRASSVLTNAYVVYPVTLVDANNTAMTIQSLIQTNQLIIYGFFTLGSLTSLNLKVEFSNDNVNWVQETFDAVDSATGVITELPIVRNITVAGNFRIPIRIRDQYVRISAEGVGTVTGSLLTLGAIIAVDF